MYNKHTLTKQDVREVLEVLSQFENHTLLTESALGDKLKKSLGSFLPTFKGSVKDKFLKGLQTIKAKIGTPSEVLADFLKIVDEYGGDLEKLKSDAEGILQKEDVTEAQSDRKYRLTSSLGKFLRKYAISNVLALGILFSVLGGYVNMAKKGLENPLGKAKIEKVLQTEPPGTPTDDSRAFDKTTDYSPGGGGSGDSGGDDGGAQPDSPLVKTLKAKNVDLDDSDGSLNNDNDESTVGTSLKTGEYKLDAKTFNNLEDQAVKAILDDIDNQLKDLKAKGQGPGEITIDIDPDGHISLNNAKDANRADGGLSNRANDGSDLLKNRGNEAKMLADLVKQKVEDAVKKLYPKTKITIKVNEPTKDDLSQQKVGKKGSAEQAVTIKSKVKVDGSSTIKFIQFLNKFSPNRIGGEPEGKPTGEEPRTSGVDRLAIPTNPEAIGRVVARFSELNRNGQIATILKIASGGSADAFAALGKQPMTSITDKELGPLQKKENKDEANLANAILYIRKNPDQFLKQFGPAIGVQLSSRAKAAQIVPGQGPQAPVGLQESAPVLLKEYQQLILEAYIEDYMSNIGKLSATDKVALLAMVGSMYRSSGGELSIIDLGTLGTGYADELRKVGFAQQPQGKGYIFLGPGQTKKDAMGGGKPQPDASAVGTAIGKNQSLKTLLSKINSQDELTSLILNMFNTFRPSFVADRAKVSNALNKLDDQILTEEIKPSEDVTNIIAAIEKDSTLKSRLTNIDNEEEAIQTVISNIIPFIDQTLRGDKRKVKQALLNAFNQFRSQKPAQTTTKSGNYTSTSTAPGVDIDNIKYVQEAKRWQKLAGII